MDCTGSLLGLVSSTGFHLFQVGTGFQINHVGPNLDRLGFTGFDRVPLSFSGFP